MEGLSTNTQWGPQEERGTLAGGRVLYSIHPAPPSDTLLIRPILPRGDTSRTTHLPRPSNNPGASFTTLSNRSAVVNMGAQQSSGRDNQGDNAGPTKTCYYELLGVERDASEDE